MELSYINNKQEIQGMEYDIKHACNKSDLGVLALILKKENAIIPGLDLDYDAAFCAISHGKIDTAMVRYDWDGKTMGPVSSKGGETGRFPTNGNNKTYEGHSKLNLGYIINPKHSLNLNFYTNYNKQNPKDELMDNTLGFKANFPSTMINVTTGLSYDLHLFEGKLQSATTLKRYHFWSNSRMTDMFFIEEPQKIKTNKSYTGWSQALRYKFNEEFLIKTSYAIEARLPSAEEINGNGYSVLPAPSLVPEQNNAVNLGMIYHKMTSIGYLELEFNTFYSTLKDMIRFTPDMIATMARYRNFGNVRTWGVEGEVKGDILPEVFIYINGTFQDLRDIRKTIPGTNVDNPSKNMRMPNTPYLMANCGAEFHKPNLLGGKGQNTRIMLDLAYVHEYFYDFEMSIHQERKIPSSMNLDAALEHSFR